MNSLRKWLYRPKKIDKSLLAQFYFADEELNTVAAELDSFDSRKDPERCQALVSQLRACQDKVLTIVQRMMDEAIPFARTSRDFRVKFPDDVVQENLAGQLWFGAECLAAGSSIMNREVESASMRPLARALTKNLDSLRCILRDQCLVSVNEYSERIREALIIFDKLFAEFELSYVSAMVPVKSVKDYETIQEITVLFSETVIRAKHLGYITTDMIDEYDPALMFTIPRLAIICGLLIYADGPLNPDSHSWNMSDMFRPFQTLLYKIRELLYTLSEAELLTLERALCSQDEPAFLSSTQRNSPPSSTTTTAVQTDALPLLTKEMLEDSQSCSSTDRSASSDIEDASLVATDDGAVGLESASHISGHAGVLGESVSCGAICCHGKEGSRSEQDAASRPKFLNKSDSNDSGLHSDGVSNSDSQYTISSSDSNQLLSQSSISSPVQSPSIENVPEDCTVEEDEEYTHYQLCQSMPEPAHTMSEASSGSSSDNSEITQDLPGNAGSEANCSASSVSSDVSEASRVTVVSSSGGNADTRLDAEAGKVSMSGLPCASCPQCRVFFENLCNVTAEVGHRCGQRQQTQAEAEVSEEQGSQQDDVSDNRDGNAEEGRLGEQNEQRDDGETGCDTRDACGDCSDTVNDQTSERDIDTSVYTLSPESQTSEGIDCDHNLNSGSASPHDLHGLAQAIQTVYPSVNDTPKMADACDDASHASNSTHELSRNMTDSTPSSSCDNSKQQLCDNNSHNHAAGEDSSGSRNSPEKPATEDSGASLSGLGSGEELAEDSTQSQCDRCTQTPHSVINNDQSSKIHHHHSRQHSNTPTTIPPAVLASPTSPSASSQTVCDNCDGSSNSAKSKVGHPSPPKSSHPQSSTRKGDPKSKTEKRSNNSTSSQSQKPSKVKNHGAGIKSPASSSAERLKQYADNWSDCSSGSDVDKRGSNADRGGRSRHRGSCVDGTASGSSGCEGSSSASDCEWDQESCSSSETSSYNSECHDDEEIALAVQAAELASRNHARARFRSSSDMIHRLFVCISGVADQLQTNFAGDLRNILRVVFNLNCSEPVVMEDEKAFRRQWRRGARSFYRSIGERSNSREPPTWIPDDQSTMCMSCKTPFTFVRRRHHCRNCGKIFCGRCSSNAVSLPHFGHTKPVRVCNRCFMFQVTPFTMQGQA
ncbi:hypothetical protein BaRGS_00014131 [Batillaria attramentaria]|uniref:FYVE-type domain-containing protein n=1 Tax=Batillaria attramentaria TaxID=370345 RepID=A0ABD0L655_9CAEN